MRGSVGSTLHKSKLSLQPLIDLIEPTPKNKVKDLQVLQQLQWTAHCGHSLSLISKTMVGVTLSLFIHMEPVYGLHPCFLLETTRIYRECSI